ncbi:unnamed protein product [Cylicocyclus nassatus]|uniref:Uncharacterized protein n=1 Tax=Cylicocyclus nassatus TaxID=53992 RepID=A0AA36HH68_CYLNA|nr:unnamed protein product [Cylicocyclus nassatus]
MLYADAELKEKERMEVAEEDITVQNQGLDDCHKLGNCSCREAYRVHATAIRALCQLPMSDEPHVDKDNKEFFPSDLIFDSLRDYAAEVREALQSFVFRIELEIDRFIEFLEKKDDCELLKALVQHLITSTFIRSFSDDSRLRFLRSLMTERSCPACVCDVSCGHIPTSTRRLSWRA